MSEEWASIGKYAVENCQVRGVSAYLSLGFKSPIHFLVCLFDVLPGETLCLIQWDLQVLLLYSDMHVAGSYRDRSNINILEG